jgi:hypothetical protein
MAKLAQKLTMDQMQTKWASQLDPVLSNLLVQGQLITEVSLVNGSNAVNHRLGRTPNGWFIVAPQAKVSVYQAANQSNPTLILTLIADASSVTSVWVF